MPQVAPVPFGQICGWLFDLDGTLMDTDDQAVEALAHRIAFVESQPSRRLARELIMLSETPMNRMMTVLDALGLDPWVFELRRRLHLRRPPPTFRLVTGVRPVIHHIAKVGQLAVVSTRSQADADRFLEQHNLRKSFAFSVTQETTLRLKPHPEPITYAAAKLGLAPSACVMVGDTSVDMQSARRAGAWAIGVLSGFGEERELWRAGAHIVLPSTADILRLVQDSETYA